jgi:hypothetical protein
MAKKSKKAKRTNAVASPGERPTPPPPRPDWDQIETDFFARASDLYCVAPLETFDDLDSE